LISKRLKEPLYAELADRLKVQISRGLFSDGAALPSVRALMKSENVSLATVTSAFTLLRDQGLIINKPRRGNFAVVVQPGGPHTTAATSLARRSVSVQSTISALNGQKAKHNVVNLGAAVVSQEWVATAQIARAVRRVAALQPIQLAADIIPAPGLEMLRIKVAQLMARRGVAVGHEDIVITNGDATAMEAALRIVLPKGKAVAIEFPTYFGILQILERNSIEAVEIATDPNTGMNLDALNEALLKFDIGAIIVNPTFHNPTGFSMPSANKRRLVDIASGHGVPIIEDDVFGDLHFGTHRPPAVKSFDQTGNVLHCSSFSKIATPGWRMGWIVPGRWREAFIEDQLITSTGVSSLPQFALAEFLKGPSYLKHLDGLRALAARQSPVIRSMVLQHFPEGTKISKPAGGFLFWVECPNIHVEEFVRLALIANVAVAPGTIFSASGSFNNVFRLSVGATMSPAIKSAISRLGEIATDLSFSESRS
jgi:DNA-binding transcriptional MocR family regulator